MTKLTLKVQSYHLCAHVWVGSIGIPCMYLNSHYIYTLIYNVCNVFYFSIIIVTIIIMITHDFINIGNVKYSAVRHSSVVALDKLTAYLQGTLQCESSKQ